MKNLEIIGQTSERKAEDKARKKAIKAAKVTQAKKATKQVKGFISEELRGVKACVRLLNNETAKSLIEEKLGIKYKPVSKGNFLTVLGDIDKAKIERFLDNEKNADLLDAALEKVDSEKVKESPEDFFRVFAFKFLCHKGRLNMFMRDGSPRKVFNNTQVLTVAKALAI